MGTTGIFGNTTCSGRSRLQRFSTSTLRTPMRMSLRPRYEERRSGRAVRVKINPDMVILAREYRGLTQAELAQRVGCQQPKIAKIEAGIADDVSGEAVMLLSAALEFPGAFFCLQEQRIPFGSSAVYYR